MTLWPPRKGMTWVVCSGIVGIPGLLVFGINFERRRVDSQAEYGCSIDTCGRNLHTNFLPELVQGWGICVYLTPMTKPGSQSKTSRLWSLLGRNIGFAPGCSCCIGEIWTPMDPRIMICFRHLDGTVFPCREIMGRYLWGGGFFPRPACKFNPNSAKSSSVFRWKIR